MSPFRVALIATALLAALGTQPASAQRGGRGSFVGGGFRGGFVGPRGGVFVGPRGGVAFARPGFNRGFVGPRGGVFFRPGFGWVGPGFVGGPWPWWWGGWAPPPPPPPWWGWGPPHRRHGAGDRAPGEAAEASVCTLPRERTLRVPVANPKGLSA